MIFIVVALICSAVLLIFALCVYVYLFGTGRFFFFIVLGSCAGGRLIYILPFDLSGLLCYTLFSWIYWSWGWRPAGCDLRGVCEEGGGFRLVICHGLLFCTSLDCACCAVLWFWICFLTELAFCCTDCAGICLTVSESLWVVYTW